MKLSDNLRTAYIDAQNRWYYEAKALVAENAASDVRDNRWWRLIDAYNECYPGIDLAIQHTFNPNIIGVRLWLKTR